MQASFLLLQPYLFHDFPKQEIVGYPYLIPVHFDIFRFSHFNLNHYSKEELLQHKNILSLLLILDKIKNKKDFELLKEIAKEYVEIIQDTPKELVKGYS